MFKTDQGLTGRYALLDRILVAVAVCLITFFTSADAQVERVAHREPLALHRAQEHLTLFVGQAEVVKYTREPGIVIIGDPAIAAASLAASDVVVLTGLKAGDTNLIVLDDNGEQIDRLLLRVVVPGDTVIVRRGVEREVFHFYPLCCTTDAQSVGPSAPTPQPVTSEPSSEG